MKVPTFSKFQNKIRFLAIYFHIHRNFKINIFYQNKPGQFIFQSYK
ncbi:hypothetical protein LEP1GSC008_3176 [Leptospira kirschneri serovar Bulgarica str. Nikolaevo]|uniref:Uncharacterized protein n=1 Tax=Leptospira kirschneri serovar Bulgarica str. Nikolaevo TaxID=1240687 RepID=M6F7D7_9LEPT|nr:hypothetical protein LEP1GSC008_3176 [Leptospira kirschneri serovar Bulgarica str. Nikolaevo]